MSRISLVVLLAFLLTGCGEDLFGASIVSLTVDPDVISLSDTGMTDEFFTVIVVVDGFEQEVDPDATRVFIQEPDVEAVAGTTSLSGNTITLGMIAKTWVGNLEAGIYDVGAEVRSETESVTQRDLATITIEE